MEFPIEMWPIAWRWCSARTASSTVVPLALSRSSSCFRSPDDSAPYSRIRCRSWSTNATWITFGSGGTRPCACACSKPAMKRSTSRRAARLSSSSSESRRTCSIRASLSMLGHAHSSPIPSGATVW